MAVKVKDFLTKLNKRQAMKDNDLSEIVQLKDLDLEDFHINKTTSDGVRSKVFCRVPLSAFPELTQKWALKPNQYVLPFKALLKENIMPEHVSALVLKTRGYRSLSELVAPRIYNYFGIDTVYNGLALYGDSAVIISIDFLKGFEELIDFQEADINMNSRFIEDHIIAMKIFLYDYFDKYFASSPRAENILAIEKIVEKFVYMYLVRAMLFRDSDLHGGNVAFIVDKVSHRIDLAPCYDLECFLMSNEFFCDYDENMKYILSHYPHLVKHLKAKMVKLLQTDSTGEIYLQKILNTDIDSPLHICALDKGWCEGLASMCDNIAFEINEMLNVIKHKNCKSPQATR